METIFNCWCMKEGCLHNKGAYVEVNLDKEEKDITVDDIRCPECDNIMKVMGSKIHGGFLSFTSSSPEEKKKSLKKRARAHCNTSVEKEKREYIYRNNLNHAIL